MRFPKKYKVHEVGPVAFVSHGTSARLVGCDHHLFAAVPVDDAEHDDGFVPIEAIKDATRGASSKEPTAEIDASAPDAVVVATRGERTTGYARPNGTELNWRSMIPKDRTTRILLNVADLAKLGKAFGDPVLALEFDPSEEGGVVFVRPVDPDNKAVGCIVQWVVTR